MCSVKVYYVFYTLEQPFAVEQDYDEIRLGVQVKTIINQHLQTVILGLRASR